MTAAYLTVLGLSVAFVLYTYVGYPLILSLVSKLRPVWKPPPPPGEWPRISITVPAYNEASTIRQTIETLLAIDYPPDRRQILIVSDASDDGTDEVVREYAEAGVELLQLEQRGGKTVAENSARDALTGEIIVNTDADVGVHPDAVKALITCFGDQEVGVASGRDVSVAEMAASSTQGDVLYVGYEMWVRSCETRTRSIGQASGCLYAIRRELHDREYPEWLQRDFAAIAVAIESGLKAVSVDDALCFVPRQASLRREFRRKARTMTNGIKTLWYFRHVLNPFRYGSASWIVFSHKLSRWLGPVALAAGSLSVVGLAIEDPRALPLVVPLAAIFVLAVAGWMWPDNGRAPKVISVPAYVILMNLAALIGLLNLIRGETRGVWSTTGRPGG